MNIILFVILAGLFILSIFASCQPAAGPCGCYGAPIEDAYIWANESLPLLYYLYVVSGRFECDHHYRNEVWQSGNTTLEVGILNCTCDIHCPPNRPPDSYVAQNVCLNNYWMFHPGKVYTVNVSHNVTITFVAAGVITTYLAGIKDIEIWADSSSPPQYFVDVVSEESSFCDHFDSYNVTRAGNTTIIVEIFNQMCSTDCTLRYKNVEHTIPLGSDFVSGGNYMVVVNDVTETFVA
jgi:hypothetical protein